MDAALDGFHRLARRELELCSAGLAFVTACTSSSENTCLRVGTAGWGSIGDFSLRREISREFKCGRLAVGSLPRCGVDIRDLLVVEGLAGGCAQPARVRVRREC